MKSAKRKGLAPCVRINGTSDIDVQQVFGELLLKYNKVQWYDYTKDFSRRSQYPNYYICYSKSERTDQLEVAQMVAQDFTVAVVFDKVPKKWYGMPVVDGDKSDLRFLDPPGTVIGLRAKGAARKDTTGFVVRTKPLEDLTKTFKRKETSKNADTVHVERGSSW